MAGSVRGCFFDMREGLRSQQAARLESQRKTDLEAALGQVMALQAQIEALDAELAGSRLNASQEVQRLEEQWKERCDVLNDQHVRSLELQQVVAQAQKTQVEEECGVKIAKIERDHVHMVEVLEAELARSRKDAPDQLQKLQEEWKARYDALRADTDAVIETLTAEKVQAKTEHDTLMQETMRAHEATVESLQESSRPLKHLEALLSCAAVHCFFVLC